MTTNRRPRSLPSHIQYSTWPPVAGSEENLGTWGTVPIAIGFVLAWAGIASLYAFV